MNDKINFDFTRTFLIMKDTTSIPDVPKNNRQSLKLVKAVKDVSLAVMFMKELRRTDKAQGRSEWKLGYATMFQFFLDFYGLARPISSPQGSVVAFPMMPENEQTFSESTWRAMEEIQATLNTDYWANHLLSKEGWRSYLKEGARDCDKEDEKYWSIAADVLRSLQSGKQVTEEDLEILAEVAQNWQIRLGPLIRALEVPANRSA